MQEERIDEKDNELSVLDLFAQTQETYEEAQARAAEENKSFAKTEFFKMDKLGTYVLRILPIAPNPDGTIDRKSYEYPVHQILMEIAKPSTGGKPQSIYVSAPRTDYAGLKTDIIDTYRKLAVAEAKAQNDDDLADKIGGNGFGGGMKYDYSHAMYIFDIDERAKGIQMLRLSHSQFKDLDDCKFKLWQKKLKKNPKFPCPISSIADAFPVEIEKKKDGKKTVYAINIDNESDPDVLTREELTGLLNAPRITEVIYRYTRYHFEATLAYLKQCDENYGLKIMAMDEMKEAIEALKAELPADDTSSFSFDKKDKDGNNDNESNVITVDSLFDLFDELADKGLGDKTEEGQDLRAKIKEFIEQEKLNIKITRSTSNSQLLDMIEEEMQTGASESNKNNKPEPEPEPENEPDPEESEEPEDNSTEENDEPEPEPENSRSSRSARNDDTNEPATRSERRSRSPRERRNR